MFTLVTGTGYTGRRILPLLPEGSVVGISRTSIDAERPVRVFDLDTTTKLPVGLRGEYGIIYTVPPAGEPADTRLQRFLPMLTTPPARFVYISTTGVYGDCGGARVTEMTPVNPGNERSARRVAAESQLEDWAAQNNCALIVLRAPGIYGPERLGLERIRGAVPVLDEQGANPGNRIHVDDLARCCVAALSDDVPAGIYNVGDGDHRSSTAFTLKVAELAGLPAPPRISREEAERQFSPARMSFLNESRVVDTTKMREVLGVTPRYADPEDGIRASLED